MNLNPKATQIVKNEIKKINIKKRKTFQTHDLVHENEIILYKINKKTMILIVVIYLL